MLECDVRSTVKWFSTFLLCHHGTLGMELVISRHTFLWYTKITIYEKSLVNFERKTSIITQNTNKAQINVFYHEYVILKVILRTTTLPRIFFVMSNTWSVLDAFQKMASVFRVKMADKNSPPYLLGCKLRYDTRTIPNDPEKKIVCRK